MAGLPKIDDSFPRLVPPLEAFVRNLGACIDEGRPLADLREDLANCDAIMSAFILGFKFSVQGYDYDEKEQDCISQIYTDFDGVAGVLSSIICDLREEDPESCCRDTCALVNQLKMIESVMARLDIMKKSKPKMSEFSKLDAILKAGNAVIEGRRDWSILINCLSGLRPSFDKLAACGSLPPEAEDYCDALDLLFRACENQDAAVLPHALEELKRSGEAMIAYDDNVKAEQEEPSPVTWLCPSCGFRLDNWEKRCPKCGSRLPEVHSDDYSSEEEGIDIELPECAQTILESVSSIREGQDSWRVFSMGVRQLEQMINYLRSIYQSLPDEAFDGDISSVETLILSREAVEDGFAKLGYALDIFSNMHTDAVTMEDVDAALESMILGIEQTRQISALGSQQ